MTEDVESQKIELLNGMQTANEAVERMLAGANLVAIGGPEGIHTVAHMDGGPELILTVIETLTKLVRKQQESIVNLNEMLFESYDSRDEIIRIIKEIAHPE